MNAMNDQYDAVIAALQQPDAYPEPAGAIEHQQTHISHLFLIKDYVYKVKKPVDFGFLNFTTLELREHFCQEELRLNRRMSPSIYLEVVEVRQDGNGRITLGGSGATIEYAVKMRRLPASRAISHLLATNSFTTEMTEQLATQIGAFHKSAGTGAHISIHGSPEAIEAVIAQNFEQTKRYRKRTISLKKHQRLQAYSQDFLREHRDVLEQRQQQGWVRDGHGDLHSAQVFMTNDGAQILDCIEFLEAFRCTDILADAAFMAMDLDQAGRHDLSLIFMDAWRKQTGDTSNNALLDFYKIYRAYVRGKVESFRLDDPNVPDDEKRAISARAQRYFNLAYQYISVAPKPKLVLMSGMVGTGKSTVARHLACDGGMAVLSTDIIRKQLAEMPPTERNYSSFGSGIYTPEFSKRTYDELFARAAQYLREGRSVLLDATFGRRSSREDAAAFAERQGADFWVVECVANEEQVKQRLFRRERRGSSVSDGRWEIYEQEKATFEPLDELPASRHILQDTTRVPAKECAQSVLAQLGIEPA